MLPNRKAIEPSYIAKTWIHYDVRCYDQNIWTIAFSVKV